MKALRSVVSKKKTRHVGDGFDLDLTYITPNIIAMGFPSSGTEGIYRNPLDQVQRFVNKYHADKFKIYNLCSERKYPPSLFNDQVEVFPFDDHTPPPLSLIEPFCQNVDQWLKQDAENVVFIHCKAGKGRTGTMIAAYLLYSGQCKTAIEAMKFFGDIRTKDGEGVTIPSQRRYVQYFEIMRVNPDVNFLTPVRLQLNKVVLNSAPNFDMDGGSDPFFKILNQNGDVLFDFRRVVIKVKHYVGVCEIVLECLDVAVEGDVKFDFYDEDSVSNDKMFHFWINTAFIKDKQLTLTKKELDKACKDKEHKKFRPDFQVQLFFK